jgi:hypothetical protein
MNIQELKKEEDNFNGVFAPALRTVLFVDTNVKPEDNGEWDSFSAKHDYYIQAFLLNSLENLLNKRISYLEFSDMLKNKIQREKSDITEVYSYGDNILFSVKLSVDKFNNMYYVFLAKSSF